MENNNNILLIRKVPLGFIQKELEKIEPGLLQSLNNSEHKIIQLHELDKKLTEFYYESKFFKLICNNNITIVETLIGFNYIPEKWIKMTEGYLECEKRRERNQIDENKFIDVMVYEFRRKYRK